MVQAYLDPGHHVYSCPINAQSLPACSIYSFGADLMASVTAAKPARGNLRH